MYNYDLITGEPSTDGSPPNSEMSEQEIIQNANMTGYDLDPNQRLSNYQQQAFYQQQQQYYNQPNPAYGGYYNPAMQGFNQNYFGNYMNPPQSGFSGYVGNPAYNYIQNQNQGNYQFYQQNPAYNPQYQYGYGYNGYYQQPYNPQPQNYTYYIPPFNTGSDVLLNSDAEEVCEKMENDMNKEMAESYVEKLAKQRQYYNSIGISYGYNYVNRYDPSIGNKYNQKIHQMRREAQQARTNLNKQLSRLCDRIVNGTVDEERIEKIYSGQTVTIPGVQIQDDREQSRFYQTQVIDPSLPYKQHAAEVSARYKKYFNNDTDMTTFFNEVGQVVVDDMMEEEEHRRRNFGDLYQSGSTYRAFIEEKLYERHQMNDQGGFKMPDINQVQGKNIPAGGLVRTLDEAATLLDDGTLSISAPKWLSDNMNIHINAKEDEYEIARNRFRDSIYRDYPPNGSPPSNNDSGGGGTGGS